MANHNQIVDHKIIQLSCIPPGQTMQIIACESSLVNSLENYALSIKTHVDCDQLEQSVISISFPDGFLWQGTAAKLQELLYGLTVSVAEFAKRKNITRNAVYNNIKLGRIKQTEDGKIIWALYKDVHINLRGPNKKGLEAEI